MDVNDCGKKYVCEISAKPFRSLSDKDIFTLSLLGSGNELSKTTSAKYNYDLARLRGIHLQNHLSCEKIYEKCQVAEIANYVNF